MAFSDVLDREAAWLSATDTLPSLLGTNGGYFDLIQARLPRKIPTSKSAIYVLRQPSQSAHVERFANIRSRMTTRLQLKVVTRQSVTQTGNAEAAQLAFDQQIDNILTRVMGLQGDKTHGGRFYSVGEPPDGITVDYADPEAIYAAGGVLSAVIRYSAVDPDFIN